MFRSSLLCAAAGLIVVTGLCGCTSWRTQAEAEIAADRKIPTPLPAELEPGTPQAAWRDFMVAVMESDVPAIRRLAIARPRIEILWENVGDFWGSGVAERKKRIAGIWNVPIHPLQVGESYTLELPHDPAARTADGNDVNETHAMLRLGHSTLFKVRKIDGAWRIDPDPLISLFEHTLF
jgi:hypothetical protein